MTLIFDLLIIKWYRELYLSCTNDLPNLNFLCHFDGIGPLPGGLTNYCPSVLDTVGWVIRPVKIVPNMTYNVGR